jgi:predicted TIM-barrel fold metal-dependent hydrolase
MHEKLGFSRGVIVQPRPYGTDHSLIRDTLDSLGPEGRRQFRASAIIRDDVTDAAMVRMNDLGFRAVRLNLGAHYSDNTPLAALQRSIDRAKEIGWHVKLHISGDDVLDCAEFLNKNRGVTFVIDHMAHLNLAAGLDQTPCRWILDTLKNNEHWWMMLSNGNRDSLMESGYDDVVPFGKAFVTAAPHRMIWGSDWPHVNWGKARMMNDAETVELLYRYVDNDAALIRKVLVENPTRLYGFSD